MLERGRVSVCIWGIGSPAILAAGRLVSRCWTQWVDWTVHYIQAMKQVKPILKTKRNCTQPYRDPITLSNLLPLCGGRGGPLWALPMMYWISLYRSTIKPVPPTSDLGPPVPEVTSGVASEIEARMVSMHPTGIISCIYVKPLLFYTTDECISSNLVPQTCRIHSRQDFCCNTWIRLHCE